MTLSPARLRFAGQELGILAALGIDSCPRKNKPCPACYGRDRFSLSVDGSHFCRQCGHGDFLTLIQKVHRCDFKEALEMVEKVIGHGYRREQVITLTPQAKERKLSSPGYLEKLWQQAQPIESGDPVDLYLQARGIRLNSHPTALRYHPELKHFDKDLNMTGTYAAMLAVVVTATGEVACIHRTYLTVDGRPAFAENNKKLTLPTADKALLGSSIRLYAPGEELALAEGIETALSYSQLFNVPSWACLNGWGLSNLVIPAGVTTLHICQDNDDAGRKATIELSERAKSKGLKVIVNQLPACLQSNKGADWNDVLRKNLNHEPTK